MSDFFEFFKLVKFGNKKKVKKEEKSPTLLL